MKDKSLVRKCMTTLKKIEKEQLLEDNINNSIRLSINNVNSIMSNDNIKIAILGEFSSGKSTFINAFLRNKLLSYADEPTTAINTYIKYGEKEKATIFYSDGSSKEIDSSSLDKYTKEGKVGKNIDTVNIEYNNEYLKKGITIIDTPGANIDNERHNLQRDKAINECSIGIFLISVKSLTSKSFIEFLKLHENSLGKFIFVISKCDMLEDDIIDIDANTKTNKNRLEDIIDYVKDSITKHSRLKNPKVYPISAYNFLSNKKSEILDVNESFMNLEKAIDDIHKQDKEVLILLEMLKVFKQICPKIRDILNDKNKLCEHEIRKVNGEIEGFERFVYNDFKKFNESVNKSVFDEKKRLETRLDSIRIDNLNAVTQRINSLSSMRDIKNNINDISIDGINQFIKLSNSAIREGINNIGKKEFEDTELNFKEYFLNLKRTYKKLGIERNLKIKKILKNIVIALISLVTSKAMLEIVFILYKTKHYDLYWNIIPYIIAIIMFIVGMRLSKDKLKYHIPYTNNARNINIRVSSVTKDVSSEITATHGFGAGAVIGGLAGGPVGALVGAGIGAVLSTFLLGSRVEEIKGEVIESLRREMDNIVINMGSNIIDLSKRKREDLLQEYKNYVGENISLYRELLEGIYNYNNNKFIGLSSSNNILKNYLKEFEDINREIDDTLREIRRL